MASTTVSLDGFAVHAFNQLLKPRVVANVR
jgi:hypothetical protein